MLETVLNNHAQHHRVHQPLILHGPRGVGKTTLILERLLENWNKGPHLTGYVDFAQSIQGYHPSNGESFPWSSWSSCAVTLPPLSLLTTHLEKCLESMAERGIQLGQITSQQIFITLNKWHGLRAALRDILLSNPKSPKTAISEKISASVLWERAVFAFSARLDAKEIEGLVRLEGKKGMSVKERSYLEEAAVALRLAKEVIRIQQRWKANAVAHLNRTGGFSRSLASSATDWPCLLLELLSAASEINHFQPKLILNNIDVLKNAISRDASKVPGPVYHDSLIWRIISLGANEMCLPVILVTSDSYYSYRAYIDFGFPDIFISRETFGWAPNEAKLHMVPNYFSSSEWTIVAEVLGSNARHLFELHALKERNSYLTMIDHESSTFEDIVDTYLAYLQITTVNPAVEKALSLLQRFALDAHNGKIPKDRLHFGAPWRHPPCTDDPDHLLEWAKIQLMDFVQSLVNTEFGLNYLADCSLEIFDDPSVTALLEVGLLYAQRDPSFVRPVSRGVQRCLVRWLVQQRLQMSLMTSFRFLWQRCFRGRYYRHLMLQIGYK